MDAYAQYKKFRSERMKYSLHFSSSKLDDEHNKSSYQNEYIDKFLNNVQKSPEKTQAQVIQPPVLLLKNKKYQLNTPQKQCNQISKESPQQGNSAVQDYIDMKKRQQILEIYVNESKIVDSAQQKMKQYPQRQLFQQQQTFQSVYNGTKSNTNNSTILNQMNSSFSLNQKDQDLSFSNRPVLTEQSDLSSKSPMKQIKCFRSLHKYLHQAQTQVIQSQLEGEIQNLIKENNNTQEIQYQQNSSSQLLDSTIQFNNSALTQLIKPCQTQSNKSDIRSSSFKQIQQLQTPNKPFFMEKKTLHNTSLSKQKDNSCQNLFDLRSTQIFKESSKTISDQQNNSMLNSTDMYASQFNQMKASFCKRTIRSNSQRTEQSSQKSIPLVRPPSRRYNPSEEEENCASSSNESTINIGSSQNPKKTRKQTISKLIAYFNTVADFKQDSREQIKLNRIESRNFLFSQNNEDVLQNYAKIANKGKQVFTPQSEEANSLDTNSLTQFEDDLKNKYTKEDNTTVELSPIITDFSMERIDFKSNMLDNMVDSAELIESSSTISSRTASPAIRPRYSYRNQEEDEDIAKKSYTLNDRPSKKNIKTEGSKSRKLTNSASVASKDTQKALRMDDFCGQIFLNKSFYQNKVPKRKFKKTHMINQSLELDQSTKKIQLKKSDHKIKLRPIESKQNSNNCLHSQQDGNQSTIFEILKTIS